LSKDTTPEVCIVESLSLFDEENRKEGEIISRTLRMAGMRPHYSYVRTREEFEAFVSEFGESDYRYLHISCHGSRDSFSLTTEAIPTEEFAAILVPHVRNRRVFLSTCLATNSRLAAELLPDSGCYSILGPKSSIEFGDSAIFWTAFYHLRFKARREAMKRQEIIETATKCANLIDQQFRLFYLENGNLTKEVLGDTGAGPIKVVA